MTAHVAHRDRGETRRVAPPGRRLGIASLLMIPGLVVSYVLAYFVGTAVQHVLGLTEEESLREAGALGVVAGLFLIVLIVVPQIVGIVLGVKARRLGEERLGEPGVVINAAIAAFLVLSTLAQLVLA